ncbi:unnamed protein product [Gadus morhua 'NCC']
MCGFTSAEVSRASSVSMHTGVDCVHVYSGMRTAQRGMRQTLSVSLRDKHCPFCPGSPSATPPKTRASCGAEAGAALLLAPNTVGAVVEGGDGAARTLRLTQTMAVVRGESGMASLASLLTPLIPSLRWPPGEARPGSPRASVGTRPRITCYSSVPATEAHGGAEGAVWSEDRAEPGPITAADRCCRPPPRNMPLCVLCVIAYKRFICLFNQRQQKRG